MSVRRVLDRERFKAELYVSRAFTSGSWLKANRNLDQTLASLCVTVNTFRSPANEPSRHTYVRHFYAPNTGGTSFAALVDISGSVGFLG